jgi:SAM-dependent methyltransferase
VNAQKGQAATRGWRSFDHVAAIYERAERWCFGGRLHAARIAGLAELRSPRRALLLGEGDGRFAAALLSRFPDCEVHVVDRSPKMLELVRIRTRDFASRVLCVQADACDYAPTRDFDLVTTLFFFDCLSAAEQSRVVDRVTPALTADATWLYADFDPGPGGVRGLGHRLTLWALYGAFGLITDITTLRYHDPLPALAQRGFVPDARHRCSGLLRSVTLRRPQ